MKQLIFITTILLSILCFGCGEDDAITIEDLYAQPLHVIQECVQGKWKWYASYGGIAGVNYGENTFVDIHEDHYTITYHDGMQRTRYFTWKRHIVLYGKLETWVMWDTEHDIAVWYFMSIKDDTLTVMADIPPNFADVPNSFEFIRIK